MPFAWLPSLLVWIGALIMIVIGAIATWLGGVGDLKPGTWQSKTVFGVGVALVLVGLFLPGLIY